MTALSAEHYTGRDQWRHETGSQGFAAIATVSDLKEMIIPRVLKNLHSFNQFINRYLVST